MSSAAPWASRVPPERDKASFNCPHCGALAHQDWQALGYEKHWEDEPSSWTSMEAVRQPVETPGDPFGADSSVTWVNNWNGAICVSCSKWSVWYMDTIVYPRARLDTPPSPDMPEEVRELYVEAGAVATVSRRAGAALARAAMERLLKIFDPEAPAKTRLDGYIDRVQGKVSTSLARMLNVVRVTGNKALHVEDQPAELVLIALDDTEGPLLLENFLETMNDLVDELITRPTRREMLWEKLPAGVKAKLSPDSDPPF